jgi:hypothetical protein
MGRRNGVSKSRQARVQASRFGSLDRRHRLMFLSACKLYRYRRRLLEVDIHRYIVGIWFCETGYVHVGNHSDRSSVSGQSMLGINS